MNNYNVKGEPKKSKLVEGVLNVSACFVFLYLVVEVAKGL